MYRLNKRTILAACIAASLLSHIGSLIFLQIHSFYRSTPKAPYGETACLSSMDKSKREKILRESFEQKSFAEEEAVQDIRPEKQPVSSSVCFSPFEIEPPHLLLKSLAANPPALELKSNPPTPVFTLPPIERLDLFEHLPKDLIVPEMPSVAKSLQTPSFLPTAPFASEKSAILPEKQIPLPAPSTNTLAKADLEPLDSPPLLPRSFESHLPDFPSLEDLGASSYSDSFDTEIAFAPMEDGEGYLFALTLIPKPALELPKIRQHFSFLIDRSNSIQKERLYAVKGAVAKALEELNWEDSFNIIAFDSKVDKLSSSPLLACGSAIDSAHIFLDQIHLGSFFSSTNLTRPLFMASAPEDTVHTAILLTDGEALSKRGSQRELALEWTLFNCGRTSLFAVGMGNDPNLAALDTATAFNRGKTYYSPTKRGIKRKLLKLIKTISHPVATHLTARPIARSSNTKITLYPAACRMPHLYDKEPYVILGTINELDDFILFVQGKLKNKWLNVKKNVSFISAKKGGKSLKAEIALQQAYSHFERYLIDLNPDHLARARVLLDPHDLPVAFQ